jgi:hypothetical protein
VRHWLSRKTFLGAKKRKHRIFLYRPTMTIWECPVCLEECTRVVAYINTACGHSLCEWCIHDDIVACPTCRAPVAAWVKNYALADMIDEASAAEFRAGKTPSEPPAARQDTAAPPPPPAWQDTVVTLPFQQPPPPFNDTHRCQWRGDQQTVQSNPRRSASEFAREMCEPGRPGSVFFENYHRNLRIMLENIRPSSAEGISRRLEIPRVSGDITVDGNVTATGRAIEGVTLNASDTIHWM